jgi:hypothetical protein
MKENTVWIFSFKPHAKRMIRQLGFFETSVNYVIAFQMAVLFSSYGGN